MDTNTYLCRAHAIESDLSWSFFQAVIKEKFAFQVHGLSIEAPGMKTQPWARMDFVQELRALVEIAVDGRKGGDDGGGAEPVGDGGEVGQVSLDAGLQDRRLADVTKRAPVLVQKLAQLSTHHSKMRGENKNPADRLRNIFESISGLLS